MAHLAMLCSTLVSSVQRYKRFCLGVAFFILTLLAVLRYGYGNDYFSYMNHFEEIHAGAESPYGQQFLFTKLNEWMPNYYIFIAVTSVLTIYSVYKLISKYVSSDFAWIGVFIYCINPYLFLMSLSAIRQSLATSLFIFAIFFAYKHKPIPYVILVFCASLFHASAIILLPFYFLANNRKMTYKQVLLISACVCVLLLSVSLFDDIVQLTLEIFDEKQYEYYYEQGMTNTIRATVLSSVYLMYILINLPRLEGTTLMCSKLYLVGCICSVLAYRLSMMTRLQMFFDIFSIVAIPMIIVHNFKLKDRTLFTFVNKYIFPILIFLIYFLRYYSFFTNSLWESFFEYETILGVLE